MISLPAEILFKFIKVRQNSARMVKVAKQKNPGLREAAFEKPFQPCNSNFKSGEPVKNRMIFFVYFNSKFYEGFNKFCRIISG